MTKPFREVSESSELNEIVKELPNHEVTEKEMKFDPPHTIGTWKEPFTKTKRITVVAYLPSGVNKNVFTIRVLEEGMTLELTVTWLETKIKIEILLQK